MENANNLVIDLTHGGVKISISLSKKGNTVFAYDIYNTLKSIDKEMLDIYGVKIIDLDDLKKLTGPLNVIYPVHLPLTQEEIKNYNLDLDYTFLTHHQAVKEILKDWGCDIPKIEITGVKGKTSCVFMLKEILIDENPLILSSLGAMLFENEKEIMLKKDISITPANIKETIDLAYKIANPICEIASGKVKSENKRKYNSAIFESSLGACGIGDVGLLTNIVENYPIAKNRSTAAEAKKQIFNCNLVACQKESLDEYYTDIDVNRVNTFSLSDKTANLYLENADCSLDKTTIKITYKNIKTISDKEISGNIEVETFAPGMHLVSNVLGVITTALSLDIPHKKIKKGLENYKGIEGRSNKKTIANSIIIEEINPGINTKAIEESINMIQDINNYYIAIGGDYGVTCEEIDEEKTGEFLDGLDCDLILTGDVGKGISEKMKRNCKYIPNYKDVYDLAIKNEKNLLFIYRSNYKELSKR